jgi:hypothetical protein
MHSWYGANNMKIFAVALVALLGLASPALSQSVYQPGGGGGGGGGAITGPLGPSTAPNSAVATTDTGTPITGQTLSTGGQGSIGWMSQIYAAAITGTGATGSAPPSSAIYTGVLTGDGTTGGHIKALITCDSHVFLHITSATDTSLFTATAGRNIYSCGWRSRAAGTATWYLEDSANASSCASPTQLNGLASEVANSGEVDHTPFWNGIKSLGTGHGWCVHSTGTGGVDIDFYYTEI